MVNKQKPVGNTGLASGAFRTTGFASARNIFWLSILLTLFIACSDSKEPRFLGKLSIKGVDNVFFKVYQSDEFDSVVGVYYEIVDKDDNIIQGMELLVGTSDFERDDTADFFTGVQDSLIYLSFINSATVYAIYDLRSGRDCGELPCEHLGRGRELSDRLRRSNPALKIQ